MAGFMTEAWAQDCRSAFNAWPSEERKASKLQDFWDWINMIRPFVTGRLALSVRDMPPGADGDTLVFDFDGGAVAAASVLDRAGAEADAAFLLSGSYADWQAMLDGYDVGKMVMYRKLMLEKGDTLQFFTAAFFWTELLAIIQSVPVTTGEPASSAGA
jgi:SCP-2 sterol transfer family